MRTPTAQAAQTSGRQELGRRLRALRHEAGLSGTDLGRRLGWSQAKVSRVETGATSVKPTDVAAFVDATAADGSVRGRLVALARDVAEGQPPWSMLTRADWARMEGAVAEAERRSRTVRLMAVTGIPPALQTQSYAERELRAHQADDMALAARSARRARLEDPRRRWRILLLENVVRLTCGSHELMRTQIEHLARLATKPNITLGLILADTSLPFATASGFTLYDDRLAAVETEQGVLTVEDPAEVGRYEDAFATLEGRAQHGPLLVRLFARLAAWHRDAAA